MFPPQSRGGNIRGESVTGPRGYFLRPAVSQLGVGISSARRNSPGMSEKAFHQLNGRAMIRVTPLCPWFLAHHVKHFAMQLLTRTGRWMRRRRWQRTGNLRRAAMNEFTNWKLRHPSCPHVSSLTSSLPAAVWDLGRLEPFFYLPSVRSLLYADRLDTSCLHVEYEFNFGEVLLIDGWGDAINPFTFLSMSLHRAKDDTARSSLLPPHSDGCQHMAWPQSTQVWVTQSPLLFSASHLIFSFSS